MDEEKKQVINRRYISGPEIRKVDQDNRTVEFVASDSSVDSYNTVLPVDKWDLTRFEKNGVVGYMHDVYGDSWTKAADPDDVIGYGRAWVEDGKLIIAITFEPADLNPRADKIYRKIQFGSLNAVSVGFDPTAPGHWGEKRDGEDPDVYYYNGQSLLEVSVVNIPANSNAVKRAMSEEMEQHPKPGPVQEPDEEMARALQETETLKSKLLTAASASLRLAQYNSQNHA